jgi:hypothetical protein
MVANKATLLARGVLRRSSYWATSNPWTRNLASSELQLEALFYLFSILFAIPTIAQITLFWVEILD